ncbi:MAG: hypothetical protein H7318_17895 [Oligoflexus sp.]|nr:hypothetical protein [Oligoflexus sp.]
MKHLDRIKRAIAANKVEYWVDRGKTPNLERNDFEVFIKYAPVLNLRRSHRTSLDGVHGQDGEKFVYQGDITITRFARTSTFYLKYFYWKDGDPIGEQGIEVQSFPKEH